MSDDLITTRHCGMDESERAQAYSPSSALDGPLDPFIEAYKSESLAAYEACKNVTTLSYGPDKAHTVDFVAPENTSTPVALHVFIHGGYWCELSKKESFFAAPDTLKRGMAFAAVDYRLAPHASLNEIVEDCCTALTMLRDRADDLGIEPRQIYVSGSSAGAHLAAMCQTRVGADLSIAGLILMSGIYDLKPLIGTYVNDPIKLDTEAALELSPLYQPKDNYPQTAIVWGEQETEAFKDQSRCFAEKLVANGITVTQNEIAGRNHFDIVHDIANDSPLGDIFTHITQYVRI